MAAKAGTKRATAAGASTIRQFDLSAELRATAERRKRPAESAPQCVGLSWSHEGIPEIAKRLSALFPSLSLDVVNEVLSELFRANPHCSRQLLASDATAKLLEMTIATSETQSVTSFEPVRTKATDTESDEDSNQSLKLSTAEKSGMPCSPAEAPESEIDAFFLDEHLASLLALDDASLHTCVKTLVSALRRIQEKPSDVRVRRIRRSNARFQAEVGSHEAALELLRLAGFVEEDIEGGDTAFIFHGCPLTSTAFLSVREALEGILDAFPGSSTAAPPPAPATEVPSKQSHSNDARRHIAEITELRLRDPRGFREAARARGAANSVSGMGYRVKKAASPPRAVPSRRAQHFTLTDVDKMRVAEEIANTPSYAEEYRRTRQTAPVRNILSLTSREYDPELLGRIALDFTNRYRASKGLAPCRWHAGIARIAAEHASQMASGAATFSHDGFDDRVRAFPVVHRAAAENLAFNNRIFNTAEAAVDGWIKSPGHEKNLRGAFNLCGIGVARAADGSFYYTQLFALAA